MDFAMLILKTAKVVVLSVSAKFKLLLSTTRFTFSQI
jgi:hypothetical protein